MIRWGGDAASVASEGQVGPKGGGERGGGEAAVDDSRVEMKSMLGRSFQDHGPTATSQISSILTGMAVSLASEFRLLDIV
jgi:hypothetical protein